MVPKHEHEEIPKDIIIIKWLNQESRHWVISCVFSVSAATLRRHLCSIRMPLESKKITSRILLTSCFSWLCVCVCVCVCVSQSMCTVYVWRSRRGGTTLSCFVLISFACNQTTQSWQAMRLEMVPVRVKWLPVSRSPSRSLHGLTHSWGAAVHVSVKTRGSELTGGPNWPSWGQITAR